MNKNKTAFHLWMNTLLERIMREDWERIHDQETTANATQKGEEFGAIKERIQGKLLRAIRKQPNYRRMSVWYKATTIAACALLCISIGFQWVHTSNERASTSTVFSGVRSIETVSLPDGTLVQLGPNSQLTYPTEFYGRKRDVQLQGQAFFKVKKDAQRAFRVQTPRQEVVALGTSFEVFDYDYIPRHKTILLEGSVRVTQTSVPEKHQVSVILKPDQWAVFTDTADGNGPITVESVDANKLSAWRNGALFFDNEKLGNIIERLEGWFGCSIKCDASISEKYRFTFTVRDETLERVMQLLQITSPLKYQISQDTYFLYESNK